MPSDVGPYFLNFGLSWGSGGQYCFCLEGDMNTHLLFVTGMSSKDWFQELVVA